MQKPAARWRVAVAAFVAAAQLASFTAPLSALAQTPAPQRPVQRGQEYYDQSRFDEAISLLKDLVDRGALTGEDLQKARELLARSYVKKGYPVQGKEMFKAILREAPTWRPDPIRVPPDEAAVFEQSLKEFQEEQKQPAAAPTQQQPATPAQPQPTPTQPKPTPLPTAERIGITSEKKPLMKQWWVWAAGGAVVVGIAAVALGGGGGEDKTPAPTPLPGFPSPPNP